MDLQNVKSGTIEALWKIWEAIRRLTYDERVGELIRSDDFAEHWWTTEPQLHEWRADCAEASTDLDLAPMTLDR